MREQKKERISLFVTDDGMDFGVKLDRVVNWRRRGSKPP